ncbi:predicted protein [Nematostella vectensis]|uniref:Uncharacterized protein n=1 Tax=Nematostella vectensis TaxID=45351 RepID=A7T5E2_NEMVE|nr:predicted protein [Nematostella vectensis]|eukprot:XP_001620921.1 hypothetical protein NEMVEDRAFT_v1g222564 [Nematostella vectensis]
MPPKKSTPVAKSTARGTTKTASKPATTTRKPTTSKTAPGAGPTGKGVASKKPTAAGTKGKAKAATSPQAKLKLREQIKQDKKGESEENLQGIKVMIRDLDDVLFRDIGGKIAAGGRWPLLIDPSGQAAMFLRYRDTNYINALNPTQVEPEVIRLALLGAIRFGKPFVLDMMEVDMFDTMVMKFDDVQKGLLPSIMDKGIFKDNK